MFSYQRHLFEPTLPVDEEMFYALVRDKESSALIDGFRQSGDAKLKRKLPAFIFQATFDETTSKSGKTGAWRKQSATRLTGLVVMDIDHVENPQEIIDEWMGNFDLQKWGILLIYITPSGHGIKVVFIARLEWGNLIDNQHRMAELLGVEVDESCKDASRMSFICKEEDIAYLDKDLFTYENKEFAEKYEQDYREGHSQSSIHNSQFTIDNYRANRMQSQAGLSYAEVQPIINEVNCPADDAAQPNSQSSILNPQLFWRGHDVQSIIDARYEGNLPCAAQSNRHTESLKLATDLLILLDGDKQAVLSIVKSQPWVQEIIQERNENVEQTVQSAAMRIADLEKKFRTLQPSKEMLKAIEVATGLSYKQIIDNSQFTIDNCPADDTAQPNSQSSILNSQLDSWGKEIEALFAQFPILADVCRGLKHNQFPAALFVAGSFLMTLMTRCTYRFYHRPEELRRLNSSTIIVGDPASGKSFATRLYKLLMTPIFEADKAGKAAINAYRELMKTKGANKEKPKKPKVVVRVHPARTSNAQFIQDMVNAVETVDGEEMQLHMVTFDTELDNTLSIQKGGSWIDKISLELKAFHNEEDGQAYSNVDSVLQDFYVTWNYVYTGTPLALKKKVNEQNFGSGLATRLTCIPLPSTNFEMMSRERTVDYDSDARLKEWAFKLDRVKGELSVQKIVDELYEWTARRMADAKDNDSRADEMLLKRCAYHGLNFAAPFIVMRHWDKMQQEGDYWCGTFETDEVDWQLAELIVNMQYACQKHYFGAMAEAYFDNKLRDANVNVQRRQKTFEAFNMLPEEFVAEDVMRCFNLSTEGAARSKISRLVADHLVEKIEDNRKNGVNKSIYRKTGIMM
ncbi:MAG: hypothetical protein IJL37_10565 [Bacteroidaceae bacterium]|nr:hypothetical protein [Bacteroidaceae bacterium]